MEVAVFGPSDAQFARKDIQNQLFQRVGSLLLIARTLKLVTRSSFQGRKTKLAPKDMLTRSGLRKKSRYLVLFSDMHP
ncbi:hypothetical protein POTOM_050084 [Populus tomentosa]|uniref:Uncharacterized protein n=1 Tax=Populus tomentosa TaxID=118781 RepID=A0A8X7Y6Z5_POPTO|nr:hypothetical protein POTOM_050084 [Populus tomentosa]